MGLFTWLRRRAKQITTPAGCKFVVLSKVFFPNYKAMYRFESEIRISAGRRHTQEIGVLAGPWKGRHLGILCSIYAYIEKDREISQRWNLEHVLEDAAKRTGVRLYSDGSDSEIVDLERAALATRRKRQNYLLASLGTIALVLLIWGLVHTSGQPRLNVQQQDTRQLDNASSGIGKFFDDAKREEERTGQSLPSFDTGKRPVRSRTHLYDRGKAEAYPIPTLKQRRR